jgi:hypothetical protein
MFPSQDYDGLWDFFICIILLEGFMSYQDTFILIAPDSPVQESIVPVAKGDKKTQHQIQYELLTAHPYQYTHEDLVYEVYIGYQGIEGSEAHKAEFLKKGHPCMRASALTKKYGWGAHYNDEGKIALYAVESKDYQDLAKWTSKLLFAMRSKR